MTLTPGWPRVPLGHPKQLRPGTGLGVSLMRLTICAKVPPSAGPETSALAPPALSAPGRAVLD